MITAIIGHPRPRKPPAITNVHVDPPSYPGSDRTAAGFTLKEHRYHVWFNLRTRAIDNGIIYKNPIVRSNRRTQRLDINAADNARLIAEMWRQVEAGDMIAKAIAAADAVEQQRLADAAVAFKKHRAELAGPTLLAALKAAEEHIGLVRIQTGFDINVIRKQVRDAIVEAEGDTP